MKKLLSIVLFLIVLFQAVSAALALPTNSPELSTPKPSAQPQTCDLFTFSDYCASVETSENMQQWLTDVADMEIDMIFYRWGLDARIRFVRGMHDAGYEISNELYSKLMDDTLDADSRIAAADEIIGNCYDEINRDGDPYLSDPKCYPFERRLMLSEAIGEAPPQIVIFKEAYYKEFPNSAEQEFLNAYGYWRRDIDRAVFKPNTGLTDFYERDAAEAIALTRQSLESTFSWASQTILDSTVIDVVHNYNFGKAVGYSAECDLWVCTATVDKKEIRPCPDQEMQALFDERVAHGEILDLGDSYQVRLVVGAHGSFIAEGVILSPEKSGNNESNDLDERSTGYLINECIQIAFQYFMSHFELSAKDADRFFLYIRSLESDEGRNEQVELLFYDRYNSYLGSLSDEWIYGVLINTKTGQLLDCFTPDVGRLRPPQVGEHDKLWWCPKTAWDD